MGRKKICKTLLNSHRDDAVDADRLHEFQEVLTEEGLPPNVEEINSNEDNPPISTTEIQFLETFLS